MKSRKLLGQLWGSVLTLTGLVMAFPSSAAFDFDKGNAAIEVVVPPTVQGILGDVSPGASDPTLIERIASMLTNGWYDAIAPYHATAVGVYSRLGRRPPAEGASNRNKNIALIYASYRVLNSTLPSRKADWRKMLSDVGLDPDKEEENTETPIGIGNKAGNAIVAVRLHDGMNQLGDEGGQDYHRQPYADYLHYRPVNTAYKLKDPSRWQPSIVTAGKGLFTVQQFVTPQIRVTLPYSYETPDQFKAPFPKNSQVRNWDGYVRQANEVLEASANLTDYQKMAAEFFNNKFASLAFTGVFAAQSRGLDLDHFVQYDFLLNMASFDTLIAIWKEKYRFDAVRPFSAIHYIYGKKPVTAWGGPGKGTVSDLPGKDWTSYLSVADHPEYPSGSASLCSAHAQASRRYLGDDKLGRSVPVQQGSSLIEPGIVPARNLVLGPWPTWTVWEQECGLSRLWAGVHFRSAIEAGHDIGTRIGDIAYEFLDAHIHGRGAPLPPAHRPSK